MTVDPRAALEQLVTALERHLEAAQSSRDPDHPMVIAAAQDLAEAFDDYDESLYVSTEVATPLVIFGEEYDDEDEVEQPAVYAGLDADEYDDEDDEDEDEDDDDDDLEDEDDLDDDDEDEDDLDDDDDKDDDAEDARI